MRTDEELLEREEASILMGVSSEAVHTEILLDIRALLVELIEGNDK